MVFTRPLQNDEAKNKANKRRFENELIMLQSDRMKMQRRTEAANLDLRTLQKKYTALGFEIKDKQEDVKKTQSSLQFIDEEIRVLKKKLNSL